MGLGAMGLGGHVTGLKQHAFISKPLEDVIRPILKACITKGFAIHQCDA